MENEELVQENLQVLKERGLLLVQQLSDIRQLSKRQRKEGNNE